MNQQKQNNQNQDSQNPQNKKPKSKIWQLLKNLFIVNDYVFDELFNMDKVQVAKKPLPQGQSGQKQAESSQKHSGPEEKTPGGFVIPKRALSVGALKEKKEKHLQKSKPATDKTPVSASLQENLINLKKIFHLPKNKDVVIREFTIPLEKDTNAAIIYIDGAADTKLIDGFVLQPLMLLTKLHTGVPQEGQDQTQVQVQKQKSNQGDSYSFVKNLLVPVNQVSDAKTLKDVIDGVVNGNTVIFIDGSEKALNVETKGWPVRSVGDPKSEKVTQGPSDAFNESFRQNLALLRKRLRSNNLVTEYFKIGWRSQTDLALAYIDGVVNPKLVHEMKRRLNAIKIAYVTDTGIIQQLVGDSPYSLMPTSLATERPDRVSAFLNEGHVAIIMDGSPFAIIAPITIWGLLHSPEDYYLSPVVGTFTRLIRTLSFFIGVITPAFYIAITNYHPEMIPTDLLLAIAATRELVPFPVILEVLMMEFAFELIREAGVRIPSILGPTIGIVGALILGQAAVQANIISPALVIVVAITALGSFTIPNIAFSFSVRLARFFFIALAAFLGFFGIAFGLLAMTYMVTGMKSLGVSMLAPVAPFRPRSGDIVIKRPFFSFDSMPAYVKPMARTQQVKLIRSWDPVSRNRIKGDW